MSERITEEALGINLSIHSFISSQISNGYKSHSFFSLLQFSTLEM